MAAAAEPRDRLAAMEGVHLKDFRVVLRGARPVVSDQRLTAISAGDGLGSLLNVMHAACRGAGERASGADV